MSPSIETTCPHCGARLDRIELPAAVFDHEFDLVCFNDHCPYYVRGWSWMEQQYGVKASYRYRIDAESGHASPLAVWSPSAFRSRLMPDDATAPTGHEEHP